ncbi:S-layer homology domain-containing protein [Candidatus Peregrinibacteria bacterium]|nr:S-layer homology domain-containing protein [Candidatus Peregrinibacteria bacterium]
MFDGSQFEPEKQVKRIEALRFLIDAQMTYEEKKKNLGEKDTVLRDSVTAFSDDASNKVNFSDTKRDGAYVEYVRYARSKGYISGYSNKDFRSYSRITLAEALSLLFRVFSAPVWQGDWKVDWHKPLMDKAFQMEILPSGLTDPLHKLTRGELTYILKRFLEEIER